MQQPLPRDAPTTAVFPTCAVCLGALGAASAKTECGHDFCTRCIATWIRVNPKCPVCRTLIAATVDSDSESETPEIVWLDDNGTSSSSSSEEGDDAQSSVGFSVDTESTASSHVRRNVRRSKRRRVVESASEEEEDEPSDASSDGSITSPSESSDQSDTGDETSDAEDDDESVCFVPQTPPVPRARKSSMPRPCSQVRR
jgi:hypothetical protein